MAGDSPTPRTVKAKATFSLAIIADGQTVKPPELFTHDLRSI